MERKYTEWDLRGNRRNRIGDDCYRAYQSSGEEQYLKAACRIDELTETLGKVLKVYWKVQGDRMPTGPVSDRQADILNQFAEAVSPRGL